MEKLAGWLGVDPSFIKTVGAFSAVGGLIDLAMYESQKAKLKAWLEDWWLRLSLATPSTFGREEANLAIGIVDRCAGASLWSAKRWLVATSVTTALLALAMAWISGLLLLSGHTLEDVWTYFSFVASGWTAIGNYFVNIVALAVSISLTRSLSRVAVAMSVGTISTWLAYCLLLACHLILLNLWGPLVAKPLVEGVAHFYSLLRSNQIPASVSQTSLEIFGYVYRGVLDAIDRFRSEGLSMWWNSFVGFVPYAPNLAVFEPGEMRDAQFSWLEDAATVQALEALMDVIANGVRIVLALTFLGAFLLKPIHSVLVTMFYNVINTPKLFFTIGFGLIGVAFAGGKSLFT